MREGAFEVWYPAAKRIASIRAAVVVRLRGLPAEDRLDFTQEALLELWRNRLSYNSRRGSWRTFSERVIRNSLASWMRHQNAHCRRRPIEGDVDSLADSLPAPDSCIELQTDVRRVLAGVSVFDREVASSLCEYSATETCMRLGSSRAAVYRAIKRLRTAFITSGLSRSGKRVGGK